MKTEAGAESDRTSGTRDEGAANAVHNSSSSSTISNQQSAWSIH